MNRLKNRALGLALALAACTGAASAAEELWATKFEDGMKKAREKNLPTMIDVYTDWCGWCKKLDRDVFATKEVKALLASDIVGIKLNPEKDRKNGAKFKIRGFPTVIFTDPDGKELHRVVGYRPAARFIPEIKKAIKLFKEQQAKAKEEQQAPKTQ